MPSDDQKMSQSTMEDTAAKLSQENPYADAELVIYSMDAEDAEQPPKHENLEKLGVTSWSLWARFAEDGVEIPIVGEASWHIWYSLSAEVWSPDPAEPVSDAFIRAIQQFPNEDVGDGWGDIEESVWQQTGDIEKYVIHLVRDAFLQMDAPEPALVIDWCQQQEVDDADD